MAPNWGSTPNGGHLQQGPSSQTRGPPPICFKCGCEGHFVVNCPQGGQSNSSSHDQFVSHTWDPNQANGAGGSNGGVQHGAQWPNNQNGAPAAFYQHPNSAPIYPVADASSPPYPQHPGPVPPAQPYPPSQQGPYQPPPNQQYGQPGRPYSYNQPPQQAYEAPSPNPQYNQGYNPQPYGQYSQPNGYPQPGYSGYQNHPLSYAPPHTGYQQSPTPYPPQGGQYAPPQYDNSQPAPYNAAHFQQPDNSHGPQYNPGVKRNTSGYPRRQFHPQQSPQASPHTPGAASNPTQYSPSSARQGSVTSNSHGPNTGETFNSFNKENRAIPAGAATHKSISSNNHEWHTEESAPTSGNGKMHIAARQNKERKQMEEGEVPEDDPGDDEFKWELEKIFKESPPTENVLLAQPLSTKFDMTPVPLVHVGTAPSVSRYARGDNLKEFIRPIRSQPQWSYLQEDPAFSDAKMQGELIPLNEILIWMARRQGVDPQFLATRKRDWSSKDRQLDLDNGLSLGPFAELANGDNQPERQEAEGIDQDIPGASKFEAPGTPAVAPGTPTLDRAGTPSFDTEDDVWAPQPGEGAISASANADPTEVLLASLGVTGSPKPVRKRSAPEISISTGEDSSRKRPKTVPSQDGSGYSEPQPRVPPHSQHRHGAQNNQPSAYDGPLRGKPSHNHSNGVPPQNISPYDNGPYSVSPHTQFSNGPQYRNAPHGMQQHGSYGSSQHGMSPQNQGPLQFQDPWAAPRKGNPQGQQPHRMNHNGHTTYTAASQVPYGNGHGKQTHNTFPLGKSSYQPFNSTEGSQSSHRNSGRANSHGSCSKESSSMVLQQAQSSHGQAYGGEEDISSPPVKTPVLSECHNSKASDTNEPDESPLTPTSAEILGKLTQPTQKDSDDTARRLRRPQPVVAEAYSRRW